MSEPVTASAEHTGLSHYRDVLRRRKWIVLFVTGAAIATAAVSSLQQQNVYEARSKIVIGQGNGLIQPGFTNAIQPYTATMSDLVKSYVVARTVIDNLGLNETPEKLLKRVSVSINPQTAVLRVAVQDHRAERARLIDQEIGVVFAGLVEERFGRATPTGNGQAAVPPLTASVFDPAHVLPDRVSPRPVRNLALAAVLGLLLALMLAFIRDHFDKSLRTREAIEQAFGLPVIGQIPFTSGRRRQRRRGGLEGGGFGHAAEAFRGLRANLQYLAVKKPLRTILVTGAAPLQGKTTVTANLGAAIARSGSSVLLIDGDLRRPRLEEAVGLAQTSLGLTNVLVGSTTPEEATVAVPLTVGPAGAERRMGTLTFMASGPLPPNPSELLSSAQMRALIERLSESYEYILLDSPPLLAVADGLELARLVDGVVLVARRNHASADEAREMRSLGDRLELNFLGVVMTDVQPAPGYGHYGADNQRIEQAKAGKGKRRPSQRPRVQEEKL